MADFIQVLAATGSFTACSMGMMVFNKLAIRAFPQACSLVALQMGFTAFIMGTVFFRSLHIGSVMDGVKWCRVVPFFVGMLLTSMFALKDAPMSLVITFRALTPMFTLLVERFTPKPPNVGIRTFASLCVMVAGASLYARDLGKPGESSASWRAVAWILLNTGLACTERIMQSVMLTPGQAPVDVSKTAASFLNNFFGMIPIIAIAFATHEHTKLPETFEHMNHWGMLWVMLSCLVGVGISFAAIWTQSLVSATSMLVLTNANKFVVILLELFCMPEAHSITHGQTLGAFTAIVATVLYARSRDFEEKAAKETVKKLAEKSAETTPLLAKTV
jgi:drug/metabolite transporter (DMT)-like permease